MKKLRMIKNIMKKSILGLFAFSLVVVLFVYMPSSAATIAYVDPMEELRGVWVATVSNIDIGKQIGTTEESIYNWKQKYLKILDDMKFQRLNAIFFQIRPANDAFYPSEYNPWSEYLVGYGVDPGWDPLEWMLEVTHEAGIEFHAWLNPYRTTTGSYSVNYDTSPNLPQLKTEIYEHKKSYVASKISQLKDKIYDNPFLDSNESTMQKNVLMGAEGKMVLNPASDRTLEHLNNTISEIITNYNVDGIHFDDYFYPAAKAYYGYSVEPWQDDEDYNNYTLGGGTLGRYDWRRDNVDKMVKSVSDIIASHNEAKGNHKVAFGISPAHMWAPGQNCESGVEGGTVGAACWGYSSYNQLYADTKKWVEEEWIHYIVPQMYMPLNDTYPLFIRWWADVVEPTNVKLYAGTGIYRSGEAGWGTNQIKDQIVYNRTMDWMVDKVHGYVFFSYRSLAQFPAVMNNVRSYWNKDAITPTYFTYDEPGDELADFEVFLSRTKAKIVLDQVDTAAGYALYRFKEGEEFNFIKRNMVKLFSQTTSSLPQVFEVSASSDDVFVLRTYDLNNEFIDGYTVKNASDAEIWVNEPPIVTDVDFGIDGLINGGDRITIKARATDPEGLTPTLKLYLSLDGEKYDYEYNMVRDSTGLYTHVWAAFYLNYPHAKMKIVASDGEEETIIESDPFIIQTIGPNQAPVLTDVNFFNNKTKINVDSKETIQMTISDEDPVDVKIYLSIDGGDWALIHEEKNQASGQFIYTWTVPNSITQDAIIKVFVNDGELETEISSNAFKIIQKASGSSCSFGTSAIWYMMSMIASLSLLVLLRKRGK